MAFIYLISENENSNNYKIGLTRSKKLNKRLKQLQTGNINELSVKDNFETEEPFKLEKMLHNHFDSCRVNGEWFELNKHDVDNFKAICERYQNIIDSLKNNPFFNKTKK